jgi:hypothetical protein
VGSGQPQGTEAGFFFKNGSSILTFYKKTCKSKPIHERLVPAHTRIRDQALFLWLKDDFDAVVFLFVEQLVAFCCLLEFEFVGDDGGGVDFVVDDLFIKGRYVGSGGCLTHFQRNVPGEECSEGEHVI